MTTPTFGRYAHEPREVLIADGLSVDQPWGHAQPPSRDAIAEQARDAVAMIVGLDTVDADMFDAAPDLRVVAKHGVGFDNIAVDAARKRGIEVVFAPGSNSNAVAELTFGLILDVTRGISTTDRAVREHRWVKNFGTELAGRTLGVIGYGRIGRLVAGYAAAFGMRVLAHDPWVSDADVARAGHVPSSLENCITSADVLTLHVPAIAGDPPLLDRARLQSMRPGSIVVNASRGGLVDEDALAQLLHDGHLAGAGLDAFSTEPLGESPLRDAPGVVLTSHIGACTREANRTMGVTVAEDVSRVLRGLPAMNSAL
ncbi:MULTISPECIES: phosphoglycerate dehydrogenase [unclassified Rhodococcus (in: high G+C Gram-positive bacteria)]|uniref:phosphoglycerate dehydrogenase n=1 Tax=unclassified Rhodococcus (in: high G+C Gram-positive bacteria) TaxID=192944 RepID=UPI001C9AC679|nr:MULTISPECIES: phosphoglycerate dehydrogenase [unclassified Rhodococcus (in: high G+C Gram-positive bacteria)]